MKKNRKCWQSTNAPSGGGLFKQQGRRTLYMQLLKVIPYKFSLDATPITFFF